MFSVSVFLFSLLAASNIPTASANPPNTIKSDFTIIGGGSSGTYIALRLQQLGHTVTLIEKNSRLGGHVNTFFDPLTGSTFDYGVISFDNISVVTNYFKYLDVPLSPTPFQRFTTVPADFETATLIPTSQSPPADVGAALVKYLAQLDKYPFLNNGFNLPSPVPEDLLISWGDFIEKYDLSGLATTTWVTLQGIGNILAQPTIYVMKYLARETVNNILGISQFLSSTHHNNQQLYNNAVAKLGGSVYLSSYVTHVTRNPGCVEISMITPSGPKFIQSSNLIIAIQPKLENLPFLDLDYHEISLLSRFNNSYYWDAVIRNSGIPDGTSIQNADPEAPYAIPASPAIYGYQYTGLPHLHTIYSSSPYYISDEDMKASMLTTAAKLVKSLGYENGTADAKPELVGFNSHAPFELTVSVDDIRGGFYGKLNGLQGRKRTFWTGASWNLHDSSQIWNWTEYTLLPMLSKA